MHPSMQPASPLLNQFGANQGVVRLCSWPNLPNVDPDSVHEVAQICALLAIRPTATNRIPQLLDLPMERVSHIIETLYIEGHLGEGHNAMDSGFPTSEAPSSNLPAMDAAQDSPRLLTRLWQRLTTARRH